MKKVWFGSIAMAALALAGSAQAADMGSAPIYKGPAPIVAPSWTGFYVGAGVGLRTSRADATTTSEVVAGVPTDLSGFATSLPLDGTAFRASPYTGLNWQFAPQWVAGVEGDFGFARQTTTLAGFPVSPAAGFATAADGLALKTTWDAGVRGRFGYLLMPTTLVYLTGGVAWQHFEVVSTCGSCLRLDPVVVTNATTRAGWTLGGGFETVLWQRWLARAEYRYADFGSAPFTIARSGPGPGTTSFIDNFDVTMRTHTVTFGLAYKFN